MSANTTIEWCDSTWSPVRGCTRVSEGCRLCYSERMMARGLPSLKSLSGEPFAIMKNGAPHWTGRVELIESQLEIPLHWKRPRRIFVNSMSDTFHEALPDSAIERIFAVMALCPQHTFQILTKRPKRMLEYLASDLYELSAHMEQDALFEKLTGWATFGTWWPLPNVWLGVSVEDRKNKNRIDVLREVPAAVRFLSIEPLLEDIGTLDLRGISWVIVGGESGPGARPMDPQWARDVRDQCIAAGVAFFFKQWGEIAEPGQMDRDAWGRWAEARDAHPDEGPYRVGKKAAGRLLDGRTWDERPRNISAMPKESTNA